MGVITYWDASGIRRIEVNNIRSEFAIEGGNPIIRIRVNWSGVRYTTGTTIRFFEGCGNFTWTAETDFPAIFVSAMYACLTVYHNGVQQPTIIYRSLNPGNCAGSTGVGSLITNVKRGDVITMSVSPPPGYATCVGVWITPAEPSNLTMRVQINAFRSGLTSYQRWSDGSKVVLLQDVTLSQTPSETVFTINLRNGVWFYDAYLMTILENYDVNLGNIPNAEYYPIAIRITGATQTSNSYTLYYEVRNYSVYGVSRVPIEVYRTDNNATISFKYVSIGSNTEYYPAPIPIRVRPYGHQFAFGPVEVDDPAGRTLDIVAYYTTNPQNITIPSEKFKCTRVYADKINLVVGESTNVHADIEAGYVSATKTIPLYVNNTQVDSKTITLQAYQRTTVTFTLTPTQAGSLNCCVPDEI